MFKSNDGLGQTKSLIVRAITAIATGTSKEVFVEQEMRRMICEWCELGIAIDDNGNHVLNGLTIPCEYERETTHD
jgi:hypothetical protein